MKKISLILIFFVVFSSLAVAHGEETFAQAEEIIMQKIPCENLTEEQLEVLGDYFMEQMHPGEAHEVMDQRMGGEGSESLKQMHISMGRTFYCGEHEAMSSGMMNTMMGRGMMFPSVGYSDAQNNVLRVFWILTIIILILLIIWLIKQLNKSK